MTVSSPASPVVEVRDVHLKLGTAAGEVNILRGVDLTVEAGRSVAVIGPSGSGKTTLLMIVGGLERPTAGQVRVAGTELGGLDEDALALFRRTNVGIVFQGFHLIPTMTALENVAVPLEFAGAADAFERAEAGLAAVGLAHRLGHYPGQLSGGEQQRVAIARAFVAEPAVLLADEPTGNLDQTTGKAIVDLLFDFVRRRRSTLVLVTHDRELAQRCDRTVRMNDGRILAEVPAAALGRAAP